MRTAGAGALGTVPEVYRHVEVANRSLTTVGVVAGVGRPVRTNATALEAFARHARGLKLDLKDGPGVLDEVLALVQRFSGLSDAPAGRAWEARLREPPPDRSVRDERFQRAIDTGLCLVVPDSP